MINLALASYVQTELKSWYKTWLSPGIIEFLRAQKISVITIAISWNAIMPAIMALLKSSEEANVPIPRMDMWLLLKGIRSVVGTKAGRFGDTCGRITERVRLTPKELFLRITQPQDQIKELVEATYQVFQAPDQTVDIKVSLAAVEAGKIVGRRFVHFFPGNQKPRMSVEKLNHPNSAASVALRNGTIHIVEDTVDELLKPVGERVYMPFDELQDLGKIAQTVDGELTAESEKKLLRKVSKERGRSIITYPVRMDEIVYILTVIAEKRGYFRKKRVEIYKYVLDEMGLRISLEHNLMLLKMHIDKIEGK
jgi:hypothetical protein